MRIVQNFKTFGNYLCFKHIVNEINSLGNDCITINTPSGPKHVYFILGLLLSDTLGINSLCECSKLFSANFYYRFCKAPKSIMHNLSKENGFTLAQGRPPEIQNIIILPIIKNVIVHIEINIL